jgi:MFS family permease
VDAAAETALPPPATARGFQLLLLVIAACAGAYARTAVGPLQETMRLALALSDNQMALLQGPALALPFVALAVPLGIYIDRSSRARLILIVTTVGAACSLLTAAAPGFVVLCISRCLVGVAAFAVNPIVLSLAADLYAPAQRGRATMAISIGQFAGMSAAFALGGALMTGFGPGPFGWRWAMLWLTAPLVVAMFLMLAAREPARTEVVLVNPSGGDVARELWQYRGAVAPLLVGIIMLEICLGAMLVWSAPMLSRSFGMSADRAGAIVATGLAVSGVLGPMTGGVLADLCQRSGGPRRTMTLLTGLALLSVPTCLFAVASGIVLVEVLFVVLMTSISAMIVIGSTLFTVIVPGELRGVCMGMLAGVCVLFGIGVAPLMTSVLSAVMGGSAMIGNALTILCIVTMLVCVASCAIGRHHYG